MSLSYLYIIFMHIRQTAVLGLPFPSKQIMDKYSKEYKVNVNTIQANGYKIRYRRACAEKNLPTLNLEPRRRHIVRPFFAFSRVCRSPRVFTCRQIYEFIDFHLRSLVFLFKRGFLANKTPRIIYGLRLFIFIQSPIKFLN